MTPNVRYEYQCRLKQTFSCRSCMKTCRLKKLPQIFSVIHPMTASLGSASLYRSKFRGAGAFRRPRCVFRVHQAQALAVVEVLVAGQSKEHGLAQQADMGMPTIAPSLQIGERASGNGTKSQFTVSIQVRAHDRPPHAQPAGAGRSGAAAGV